MKLLRVFPSRNSHTPTGPMVFVGDPPLFRPTREFVDEVHISCVFTWDKPECERLRGAYEHHYDVVRVGGPAYDDAGGEFVPGRYMADGITITSRGCPNSCSFCLVSKREGKLRELEIQPGNIIQDNNILATSKQHFEAVCEMLSQQKRQAIFRGGLEAGLLSDWHAEKLLSMRVGELFFACDAPAAIKPLRTAMGKIEGIPRDKKRCYVLIGYKDKNVADAEGRLKEVWDAGCLPFAQLYQPDTGKVAYSKEWKDLARTWSRPAATKARIKEEQQ